MKLDEFYIPGKTAFPHQARELAKSLGYGNENLYENLDMGFRYASCTYDILYSSDVIPIHTHNFYEIALCESGNAGHLTDSQRFTIEKGDITIIPPNVRHCPVGLQSMSAPYKRIILFINTDFFEKQISVWPHYEKHRALFQKPRHFKTLGTPHEKLWKYFKTAIMEYDIDNPYSDSFLCGIVLCLLSELMAATDSTLEPTVKHKKELLENIISYVEKHLSEKIVLNDIIRQFHVSKNNVSRLFQNTMGCSFHDYLIQTRLDEAKSLLQQDVNLDRIAELSGFGDYSNFYRTFKKEYDMTPSEYRQNLALLNSLTLSAIMGDQLCSFNSSSLK